jgi:prolyl oligopeptidase
LKDLLFVEDGFNLPLAKSKVDWISRDCIYVGTDFGANSLTRSGFPRIVKKWKRGEPLEKAETVFEGERNDVGAWAMPFERTEGDVHFFIRPLVAFKNKQYILESNVVVDLKMPLDTNIRGVIRDQVIIEVRADWKVKNRVYLNGSIVSADLTALRAGEINLHLVIGSEDRTSICDLAIARDFVIVNRLENLACVLYKYEFSGEAWVGDRLGAPGKGTVRVSNANGYSNAFFYTYAGFLSPTALFYSANDGTQRCVRKLPAYWDSEHFSVSPFEAISNDGTKIPYSVVHRRDMALDGCNPTLLSGYGSCGSSRLPAYSPEIGASWLEKGGVYALANIRGGGEFGQGCHHAARKENRQTTFDDFIAVANDLIERGFTSPKRLSISGRSLGGLLIGAVVTQRPDLFSAAYCGVPVLDMKRYHRLLAGATHISEYGDPDVDEEWDYIS